MKIKNTVLVLSILILSGCAAKTISQGAANIQVHQQGTALLNDCKKLGPVSGHGDKPFGNALGSGGANRDALSDLRESTYALRGDSVAVVNREEGITSVRMLGVAYRCF